MHPGMATSEFSAVAPPRHQIAAARNLEAALGASAFVHVSSLRADESEGACRAKVWFAWLDGAVVINTPADSWRATRIARGLDRVRLRVGDLRGPIVQARGAIANDALLLGRLLDVYAEKYPEAILRWHDRIRSECQHGSRVLIRYTIA